MKLLRLPIIYTTVLAVTLAFLYLVKALDVYYPLQVSTVARSGELSVVGEGKVDVVPDTVMIDLGISVSNLPTAIAAQQQLDNTNNKIVSSMKQLGIDEKDITTANYSVNPEYVYDKPVGNKITGYSGNASISVKLTDISKSTQVISEATKAGANQIQGTRFVIDDPAKFRDQARSLAIENAKTQANKLASQLGIHLGRIVNIVESAPSGSGVVLMDAKMAMGGGAGPVVEPGSQTVYSTVTLFFEKK